MTCCFLASVVREQVHYYPDESLGASNIGIRNWPAPAEVSWRDKDGNPHQAAIDLAAIFKEQTVLHKVRQDQLPPLIQAPVFPDIMLEVNDRTINVYMRAAIYSTVLEDPANPYSNLHDDLMLAWSHTYQGE